MTQSKLKKTLSIGVGAVGFLLLMGVTTAAGVWWLNGGREQLQQKVDSTKEFFDGPVTLHEFENGSELRLYWNEEQLRKDRAESFESCWGEPLGEDQ
ncbi:MAG: hypothetical protein ACYTG0_34885 [Planctomycetota bacterium]|jgi:hypothetical protein